MTETTLPSTTPPLPASSELDKEIERRNRRVTIIVGIAVLFILALIVLVGYELTRDAKLTESIRDVMIIFMALFSIIIGTALVVLIVQIASLINLLNNEIKPILDATNETIATLRGTTAFLSENVVEPVVKLNSYLAGLTKALELIGLKKK